MTEDPHPDSANSGPACHAGETAPPAVPSPDPHAAAAVFRKPAPPSDISVRSVGPRNEEPEAPAEGFTVQPFDALLVIVALVVVAILGYAYVGRKTSSGPLTARSIVAARSDGAPTPASPAATSSPGGSDQAQRAAPAAGDVPGQSAATESAPQAEESTPQLQLVGLRCHREEGSNVIEGVVRNATTEPLAGVFAVGTWGAADGQVVKTDDTPVKDDPIPPRQLTSFRVSIPERSEVTFCQVAFRSFGGGPIPWVDARPR